MKCLLEVSLKLENDEYVVGYLPWPYLAHHVERDGDFVTVHDELGEATFSLGDVALEDLLTG